MASKRRPEPVEGNSSKPAKAAQTPAATSDSAPVQALLDAIRKKEKWLVSQLNPPASPAALETLRALEVPPLLSALYAMHDGTEAEFFRSYTLLPIEQIVSQRAMMNGLLARTPEWVESGTWNATWVPFLADGDGQLYCVDPSGSFESGAPGQILFYDHETGPNREFASFDVLLGLLTTLAKKGLLDQGAQEENAEKYEELYADAKNVGMPKLAAKDLKAVEKSFYDKDGRSLTAEQALAIALPLVRKYPAEPALWYKVMYAAQELERWPLLAEAARAVGRLSPPRERRSEPNNGTDSLVLALHRLGRDEEALAMLTAALKICTNNNAHRLRLLPKAADAAFRRRALVIATEIATAIPAHRDMELWLERGSEATDPAERVLAFEALIALCENRAAAGVWSRLNGYSKDFKKDAERQRAVDGNAQPLGEDSSLAELKNDAEWQRAVARIVQLTGLAKHDAILAAAKQFPLAGARSEELWQLAAGGAVDSFIEGFKTKAQRLLEAERTAGVVG